MANSVGKKFWYLDTTGEIATKPVWIKSISWIGTASSEIADGDVCDISETAASTPYWYRKGTAAIPDITQNFGGKGLRVDGLYLNTLGHGAVIVIID